MQLDPTRLEIQSFKPFSHLVEEVLAACFHMHWKQDSNDNRDLRGEWSEPCRVFLVCLGPI